MTAVLRVAGIGCALAGAAIMPAAGQEAQPGMLDQLQRGAWDLRYRPPGEGMERICVQDAKSLIQLRHPLANCEQRVIDVSEAEVAVHYTCRGQGYGLTRIRKETGRLIQIDSQGVADGRPFSFSAEGRHAGDC